MSATSATADGFAPVAAPDGRLAKKFFVVELLKNLYLNYPYLFP